MKVAWGARIVLMALCAGIALHARAESDKITLVKNKEVILGKITKDDKDGLEIEIIDPKAGGARRTFNSAEIADVDFDVSAEGFHEAVSAFRTGSYSRAADNLQGFIETKEAMDQVKPVARPYVLYLYGESKFRSGKAAEAIVAYQKLIDTYKTSRYVAMALTNMADSAIQAKNFAQLPALLAQLRDGGPDQKQLADFYEGEALSAQNKIPDALKKYASAAGGNVAKVKAMALVGQARCLMVGNDFTKARDAAQAALLLLPSEIVAANAHNLVGDAILAEAEAKHLTGQPLQDALSDAVLEYLRVHNQYPADARTEGYALLRAAECFKKLSKLPGRTGIDDRGRAVMLFNQLSGERRFANTEYPNLAFKALDDMR